MQFRQLLSASVITVMAPLAFAQDTPSQQNEAKPAQPSKPKPKPKPAAAQKKPATEAKARLLERVKDWNVFVYEGTEGRVCFAAAAPTDMQPKTAKRTAVIFYVTTWQKDGVRNEISVKQGYAMKATGTATVTIGGKNFVLTPDDDKAYAKDPAEERKLLAAMANGGSMVIKATSAKGTVTTDEYSLDGASLAVQKLQEACPVAGGR